MKTVEVKLEARIENNIYDVEFTCEDKQIEVHI